MKENLAMSSKAPWIYIWVFIFHITTLVIPAPSVAAGILAGSVFNEIPSSKPWHGNDNEGDGLFIDFILQKSFP